MTGHLGNITRKGQVTIPAEIRRALHLNEGDTVAWRLEGDEVRMLPMRFTLESALGSVPSSQYPEEYEDRERAAKVAKAQATMDELRQTHGSSASR